MKGGLKLAIGPNLSASKIQPIKLPRNHKDRSRSFSPLFLDESTRSNDGDDASPSTDTRSVAKAQRKLSERKDALAREILYLETKKVESTQFRNERMGKASYKDVSPTAFRGESNLITYTEPLEFIDRSTRA